MLEAVSKMNTDIALVSHELVKLLENTDEKIIQDVVNNLKEKYLDDRTAVSNLSLYLLTSLVEKEKLSLPQCLSTLVSLTSSGKQSPSLVSAIGRLLLQDASVPNWKSPYKGYDQPNPLVIILKHDWQAWDAVSLFIHSVLLGDRDEMEAFCCLHTSYSSATLLAVSVQNRRHPVVWRVKREIAEVWYFNNKLAVVRPIARHVFLDPKAPLTAKSQLLQLYMDINCIDEIATCLAWQQIDVNWCWLVREALIRSFDIKQRENLTEVLAPVAASCIRYLVVNGHDPGIYLSLIKTCLNSSFMPADPILCILANTLQECSAVYVRPIAKLCLFILSKGPCNPIITGQVVAALLGWTIYPSSLTYDLGGIVQDIISFTKQESSSNSGRLTSNPLFGIFSNSSSSFRKALELSILADKLRDDKYLIEWLEHLKAASHEPTIQQLSLFLSAIAIHSKQAETCQLIFELLLLVIALNGSFNVLCLILYKISQEVKPTLQLKYLKLLPRMALDKENVPLILGTIESLKRGNSRIMAPLRISLFLELWKVEPRTFLYLHRILQEPVPGGEEGWEVQLSRAVAFKAICSTNASQYGKDLVGLLSGILNNCSDEMGTVPSAIAMDAITDLCRAQVVDIKGTWSALEQKMGRDRRHVVIASVCRLLGEVPNLQGDCSSAISRLWSFVTSGIAVEDALKALGNFALEDFTLKNMPEVYRKGLKLPSELVKTAVDAAQRPEDVLTYVPGECWVNVIERSPNKFKNAIEDMMTALVKTEVKNYPRGIYHLSSDKMKAKSFSYLPPSSLVRSLTDCLLRSVAAKDFRASLPFLRILSKDFIKPLPHIDWSFLQAALEEPECMDLALSLLVHQGPIAESARKLIETHLPTLQKKKRDASFAMSLLPDLCRFIPPTIIHPYLSSTLQSSVESALKDNKNVDYFKSLMKGVCATIAFGMVPEPNKITVIQVIENIFANLVCPLEHEVMEVLANCIADMPDKVIERITSPLLWWEVTSLRIRQSAIIQSHVALRKNVTNPLACLNAIIDASCSSKDDHTFITRKVVTVIIHVRSHASVCSWLLHLMGRILASVSSNTDFETSMFLLDLLLASVIALSGTEYLLNNLTLLTDIREHRLRLFPLALYNLFQITVPEWPNVFAPILEGTRKLLNWNKLPIAYHECLYEATLSVRGNKYFTTETRWPRFFSITKEKTIDDI